MENNDEPETINVWELMKGLENDDDDADKYDNSSRLKEISKVSSFKHRMASGIPTADLPSDSFTLEPTHVKEIPEWLSSFRAHYGHGSSEAPPQKISSEQGTSETTYTLSTSDATIGEMSRNPSRETLADHLQSALSFESPEEKFMRRSYGGKEAFDAYRSQLGLKRVHGGSDASLFNWRPREPEVASLPSSPSFAGSASPMNWFRDDSRSLKWSNMRPKVTGYENQPKLPPQQVIARVRGGIHNKGLGGSQDLRGYDKKYLTFSNYDIDATLPKGQSKSNFEAAQDSRVRRYRRSFTDGGNESRNKQSVEEKSSSFINRPSSSELEKAVAEPNVKIVLYSTSLPANTHAYEESNAVRAVLMSLVGASFDEKSISQHPEYEQELKKALNTPSAIVPTLLVRGRYISGLDGIMQLYKKGILGSLVLKSENRKPKAPCLCRGGKFLICPVCKGRRELVRQGEDTVPCRHCIATGLIKCPSCSNP